MADIELAPMHHGPNEVPGRTNPARSRPTNADAAVNHPISEVDDETQTSRDADSALSDNEAGHFQEFRDRGWLMPHWRNVLETPRAGGSGSIVLIAFRNGDGVVSRRTLSSREIGRPGEPWAEAAANENADGGPGGSRLAAISQAVFVSDLSWHLISRLGLAFDLSPEVFEHHLVRSGYTAKSYHDPDPSTWPTRFLPQQQVSLRWFSLVASNGIVPGGGTSRDQLLGRFGLAWESRPRRVYTTTNIFRQQWPVSTVYRPRKGELQEDDTLGDDSDRVDKDGLWENPGIVAWEERVTFCWGNLGHARRPIFLFDPLPHVRRKERDDATRLLPFSGRLAPRQPPPGRLGSNPASLQNIRWYVNSTQEACSDAEAWLDHLARHAAVDSRTGLDLQLLAVLHVVRQDTTVFMQHISTVLDEISAGIMDEKWMQDHLGHWRPLLGRFQSELPALDKSIRDFFAFPYRDRGAACPAELTTAVDELCAGMTAATTKCERLQQTLRAEMSLLESKRGIEEAEGVSRLTELAFLFIPITFAASLFSMQLRELVENPPPAYAFVITAVVIVSVSYSLRAVQRSSAVSEMLNNTAEKIRLDEHVKTRHIPARTTAIWVLGKVGDKALISVVAAAALVLIVVQLWTAGSAAMDGGFKAAITALVTLFILLGWLAVMRRHPGVRKAATGDFNMLGFGSVWQANSGLRSQ